MRKRLLLAALGLLVVLSALVAVPAGADEGWVIDSFEARIDIRPDGALEIVETIRVDFGPLQKHGIFRDIPVVYDYDQQSSRVYDLSVSAVTDAQGRRVEHEVGREGSYLRIKIGDPDVFVSGPQSYRLTYRVRHALNGFADRDELFWNVNGPWPVRTQRTAATVTLPRDGIQRVTCYQGEGGSQQPCRFESAVRSASFEATRALAVDEQLTIVVALPKGMVPEPQPTLEKKLRELPAFFDATPAAIASGLALLAGGLGLLGWGWWRFGRDRRYTSVYYLTDDPNEETRPLLSSDPIVVEFKPPEGLRPAQAGLLLDESADTLDATATIVDLAVRGYLRIEEVPKDGLGGLLFGGHEWELTRTDKEMSDLLGYEQIILGGLFDTSSTVRLSALKNKFYLHLDKAKKQLYADAMTHTWFAHRPDRARVFWSVAGILVLAAGIGSAAALGMYYGAALATLPLALIGLLLTGMARWMPRRTARGRELLRRTLGFRQYVATAEKDRQKFNEQQNLFAEYLPWAIVFRCVDKWARAFRDVDMAAAAGGWYVGTTHGLGAAQFSRELQGFSSAVSSTIVSTPGGSGGSGFSGGAGGGGGGGGGGSW